MRFIVYVKHYVVTQPEKIDYYGNRIPEGRNYDYDDQFIFSYDMKTLRIEGTSWSKDVIPDEVADTIQAYFKGTNYTIADIVQHLN